MAMINTETLEIPPIRAGRFHVRPCGTGAAYRRHYRRGEPVDQACQAWHNNAKRSYRAGTGYRAPDIPFG